MHIDGRWVVHKRAVDPIITESRDPNCRKLRKAAHILIHSDPINQLILYHFNNDVLFFKVYIFYNFLILWEIMTQTTPNRVARGRPRKGVDAPPSSEQLRRLKFIESAALWTGRVGRNAVAQTFDLSLSHVTHDFSRYRALAPNNLDYDVTAQCYRPTPTFKPMFSGHDTSTVLEIIASTATLEMREQQRLLGFSIPVDIMRAVPAVLDKQLLMMIVRSLTAGSAISATYQSLSTPEPRDRVFRPHALIFTGYRWLVRGWDALHGDFRDLALARFLSAVEAASPSGLPRDELWHERITLSFSPSDGLSDGQKIVVIREYGMARASDGRFLAKISTRRAMVPYLLDWLRLRPDQDNGTRHPIQLQNYNELARYDRQQR